MSGGPSIIDFRAGESRQDSVQPADEVVAPEPREVSEPDLPGAGRLPAIIAALATLAWFAVMLVWAAPTMAGLGAVGMAQFVAALCAPPALLGIVWLLVMRTSTAEARRFGDVSRAMRAEAAGLERTVGTLGTAIDANRERLAEQLAALMTMGDTAQERLATIGRELDGEITQAATHARTLADAVTTAQTKLEVLLTSLPRARAETAEAADLLERTGLAAGGHAAALDAQLVALAERGREADVVAGGAAQRLAAHIARMEATSENAGARLETVTGEMSLAVDALLGRTAEAVDEARKSIGAQGDAMLAMVGASQSALDHAASESAEALAGRIAGIEQLVDRVVGRLSEQRMAGNAIVGDLDQGLAQVEGRLDALHTQGVERTQVLAASISALGGSADAMTEALRTGDAMASHAISTAEALLVALDATAREIDETLPESLGRLDARIAGSKTIIAGAKPELLALVTAADSTHDAIEAIAGVIADQRRTVDTLSGTLLETLSAGRSKADALGQMVDETIARTIRFSDEAAPRLVETLLRVRDTASAAADRARETLSRVIPEAAQALEAASGEAMRRATSGTVEREVQAIGAASDAAADAADRAVGRVSAQVRALIEQTSTVENRIVDARADRENAETDTFSRRASLLIDSINSAAIDISKSFETDIPDSAWAAYLEGDRGVFTRRAVRLLDATEAREIALIYDSDEAFRETVNRYIHDFEAMLRAILGQRDGTAIGVTLLSSDMGKLYVALAQAIERLR